MRKPSEVPAPILSNKHHSAPSAFTPQNLLREARRQKGLAATPVPEVCVLDPDGDMVRRLRAAGRAHQHPAWACYHTDLYRFTEGGLELGLVGRAVGAPFAVLVAEQLFASSCRLLTGCCNLRTALASICLTRSRVTLKMRPTSSSV